jgi:hypothetical protein
MRLFIKELTIIIIPNMILWLYHRRYMTDSTRTAKAVAQPRTDIKETIVLIPYTYIRRATSTLLTARMAINLSSRSSSLLR